MSFTLLGILNAQAAGAGGAGAYDLLETTVLTSSASSVSFTGLDAYTDYKHLQIRTVTRGDRNSTSTSYNINLNNDFGNNYTSHDLSGDGSSVTSNFQGTSLTSFRLASRYTSINDPTGAFGCAVVDILDFSSTTKNTTMRSLTGMNGSSINLIELKSGLFIDTAAVTQIDISDFSGNNFVAGSRFSLYGLKG